MEGWGLKKLKETAVKFGYKVEKLPSGALLFIKGNEVEIQLLIILDSYYIKYIKSGRAFLIYDLNDDVTEAIFMGSLDKLNNSNIIEIPSY